MAARRRAATIRVSEAGSTATQYGNGSLKRHEKPRRPAAARPRAPRGRTRGGQARERHLGSGSTQRNRAAATEVPEGARRVQRARPAAAAWLFRGARRREPSRSDPCGRSPAARLPGRGTAPKSPPPASRARSAAAAGAPRRTLIASSRLPCSSEAAEPRSSAPQLQRPSTAARRYSANGISAPRRRTRRARRSRCSSSSGACRVARSGFVPRTAGREACASGCGVGPAAGGLVEVEDPLLGGDERRQRGHRLRHRGARRHSRGPSDATSSPPRSTATATVLAGQPSTSRSTFIAP